MIEILKLNTLSKMEYEEALEMVKYIFYVSSSVKEFSSPDKKETFFKRWCGDYITNYPEQFLLMREDKKVLGYLSGCMDSCLAQRKLDVPGFSLFSDLFPSYPAHFHINYHPDCRGRGLGSQLVSSYSLELKNAGIQGVHLVTSPGAANVSFYRRCGFQHEVIREINQSKLLFMGKILE